MKKKIIMGVVLFFVLIQFFRPEKNVSDDRTYDVSTKYGMSGEVQQVLAGACNDCHSNKTVYPWYSNIQPIAWWLNDHVNDGKRHLNFSAFTHKSVAYQNHKFEETIEMVEEKEMPLPSYTYLGLHKEADLTDTHRELIIDWAKTQMTYLKNTYPADSLKMKRRGPAPSGS